MNPGWTSWLITQRKPIPTILAQSDDGGGARLKRSIGVWGVTALGVGAIIGTGIFVLTGKAAALDAGPSVVISFVVAGIVSALAALCYAELASVLPIAGSAYTYVYATLGELLAWIVGWALILEYGLSAATVAIGWSGYFADFLFATFNVAFPKALLANRFDGGWINLPALCIIALITVLLVRGTQESSTVNKAIVIVKVAIVIFFIVLGVRHVDPANWHPFAPFGINGVINGAGLVFFAYIGFDAITTSAEEVINPARDLPRGIIASLALCGVLYVLVSLIITGIVPYKLLNVPSPVSYSLIHIGLPWAGAIVAIGAIGGLTTVLLVTLYGQSRILFTMSRDGLLPRAFSRVHPRYRTPYMSSIIIGVVVAAIAATSQLDVVASLVNVGALFAFALVSISVVVLRWREPDLNRRFRVPWSPVLPILSAAAALGLMLKGLPPRTLLLFLIWMGLGIVIYFLYGRKCSTISATQQPIGADTIR